MAHDTDGWPTRVFRYGAPGWGGKRAIAISDHGREQLMLAHRLRNDLVQVAQTADDTMTNWWAERLPAESAAVAAADDAVEEALAGRNRERARQRRRDIEGPAEDALAQSMSARKAAAAALKAAKSAVRAADPDGVKEMQSAARMASKAETKRLYARYAGLGLYWATINDVTKAAAVAEQRIIADRGKGIPAKRRYARWDGSGGLSVQLQRATGDPRRTIHALASGAGKWRNVLRIGPSEYGPRMRRIDLTTGSGRPMVGVDVVWHRDLPDGADVCEAKLVAERVAGRTRYSVHVTARVPVAEPVTSGPDIAVHVGWRSEDGVTRVAAWRSTEPVVVPARLEPFIAQDTPMSGRVLLPPEILHRMACADQLRSGRDLVLDEVRVDLAAFLDREPQPPIRDGSPELTGAAVRAWKSPGRFAAVALAWRTDPSEATDEAAARLEKWRKTDRAMWETEANGRAHAVRYRREAYRLFAAWVAGISGRVVLDDTDLSAIQRRPKKGELLPGVVEDRIAGRRADVAAGSLREEVVRAATRDGVPVVKVSHKDNTLTHHKCGHRNPADTRWLSTQVTCDKCAQVFDQDHNATFGMLKRAAQQTTP